MAHKERDRSGDVHSILDTKSTNASSPVVLHMASSGSQGVWTVARLQVRGVANHARWIPSG
jgi:hypothetical protein